MVDITVYNNEVHIENRVYHSFNDKDMLADFIRDVIDKAKYSGESITLSVMRNNGKFIIGEW